MCGELYGDTIFGQHFYELRNPRLKSEVLRGMNKIVNILIIMELYVEYVCF